jgi:hypothetical protein
MQGNANKNKPDSFISFYFLGRIGTFQRVTGEKIKKSLVLNSPSGLCAKRFGSAFLCLFAGVAGSLFGNEEQRTIDF